MCEVPVTGILDLKSQKTNGRDVHRQNVPKNVDGVKFMATMTKWPIQK